VVLKGNAPFIFWLIIPEQLLSKDRKGKGKYEGVNIKRKGKKNIRIMNKTQLETKMLTENIRRLF